MRVSKISVHLKNLMKFNLILIVLFSLVDGLDCNRPQFNNKKKTIRANNKRKVYKIDRAVGISDHFLKIGFSVLQIN